MIEDVYYGSAWSCGCTSFYYVRPDKAMRPWQVWRHVLGTPAARDQLVYQEDDERFFVSVELTRSQRFVLVTCESKMSTEVHYLRADKDKGGLSVVLARRRKASSTTSTTPCCPAGGTPGWSGPTGAPTARSSTISPCSSLPVGESRPAALTPLLAYRPSVKIESVDAFARHLLVLERSEGMEQLRAVRLSDGSEHVIAQPEPAYALSDDAEPGVGHRRRPLRL